MRNKANMLILLTTILLGAALTVWLDNSSAPPPPPANSITDVKVTSGNNQEIAPDFSFTDLSGKSHKFADYKGKVIIINFWATWCAPCVVEFPKLLELANNQPDIILLALSSDNDDQKIRKFLGKQKTPGSNVIIARDDKRHITADLFKTYKLPESLIISAEGKIVRKIVGDTDWNSKEISELLASLAQD